MNWLVIGFIICAILNCYDSTLAVKIENAVDFDLTLEERKQLNREERSPDYGAGLGGPLAASSWTAPPKGGKKPAAKPATTSSPATQSPSATSSRPPTTTHSSHSSHPPSPTQAQPTAASKAPQKSEKSPGMNGGDEDKTNVIYSHPSECGDPPLGGVWAPVSKGESCGNNGPCPYPQKWCAAKSDTADNKPDISCQDLTPECQRIITGMTSTLPPAPTEAPTTTTVATTKTTTKTTTTTASTSTAGTTTAGASSDCQDKHPFCCFWADASSRPSECDRNSRWMKTTCPKSCGTCGCTTGDCPTKVNTQGCPFLPGANSGAGSRGGNAANGIPGGPPAGLTRIIFG